MLRRLYTLVPCLTTLVLSSACRDIPSAVGAAERAPMRDSARAAGRVVSPVNCDVTWSSASGGDWNDASRWTPAGVPGLFDQVCFTTPGTYIVTLPASASALDLWVGDGVAVTLSAGALWTLMLADIAVAPLASLTIHDCLSVSAGALTVEGRFAAGPGPSCVVPPLHRLTSFTSSGIVELTSATLIGRGATGVAFSHRGALRLTGVSRLDVGAGDVTIDGWTVSGGGVLAVDVTAASATNGEVRWVSGMLPARDATTGAATIRVQHGRLVLADSTLSGAIDATASTGVLPTRVQGDIGSAMDVGILGDASNGVVQLEGGDGTSDVFVHGRVTFARATPTGADVTLKAARLVNEGHIAITNVVGTILATALENRGTLEVLSASARIGANLPYPALARAVNSGTIHVRSGSVLALFATDLEQQPAGSVRGLLFLYGQAGVSGSGVLDEVWITQQSYVAPGTATAPVGALTFTSLELAQQPTSNVELRLDVDGATPGMYDVVRVTNRLALGGTLLVRTASSLLGSCGDRVPVLSIAKGATLTRAFDQSSGLALAADRRWRLVAEPTTQSLVGFDPRTALSLTPGDLAVSEGGAAAATSVCLGGPAPTAPVTVTGVARGGQVSVAPVPLTFTTSNWALPQSLQLQAIDDVRSEGPQVDSVRFTLASTDARYVGVAQRQQRVDVADNDPAVDLALSLVASDNAALVNEQLDARFRVSNTGPGTSTGSTFTLTPMAGLAFVAGGGPVSCTPGAGVLTCTVGALAPGASVEFTLLFRAVTAGTHTNTARVAGRDFDPSTVDNALAWVVTIS